MGGDNADFVDHEKADGYPVMVWISRDKNHYYVPGFLNFDCHGPGFRIYQAWRGSPPYPSDPT
jgi:hypothetical protein